LRDRKVIHASRRAAARRMVPLPAPRKRGERRVEAIFRGGLVLPARFLARTTAELSWQGGRMQGRRQAMSEARTQIYSSNAGRRQRTSGCRRNFAVFLVRHLVRNGPFDIPSCGGRMTPATLAAKNWQTRRFPIVFGSAGGAAITKRESSSSWNTPVGKRGNRPLALIHGDRYQVCSEILKGDVFPGYSAERLSFFYDPSNHPGRFGEGLGCGGARARSRHAFIS